MVDRELRMQMLYLTFLTFYMVPIHFPFLCWWTFKINQRLQIILPFKNSLFFNALHNFKKLYEIVHVVVKGAGSYFSMFSFLSNLKNRHFKHVNINFIWNGCTNQFCIYAFTYILLCNLNYGYQNQAFFSLITSKRNTIQLWDCTSAMRKNMTFLVIPKSPNVWKKLKR